MREARPVRVNEVREPAPAVRAFDPMLMEPKPVLMDPEQRTPDLVILSWTAFGRVVFMNGVPPAVVTRTLSFAVAKDARLSAVVV